MSIAQALARKKGPPQNMIVIPACSLYENGKIVSEYRMLADYDSSFPQSSSGNDGGRAMLEAHVKMGEIIREAKNSRQPLASLPE